jgi:dynein heavy chain
MYLSTLESYFGVIQDIANDFKSLENVFPSMMYQLLLIYQNSEYYNTPSRIVLLLREICNSLIQRASEFVPGELVV